MARFDSKTEELLETHITQDYVPRALNEKPEVSSYELSWLLKYVRVAELRQEGFSGARPLTLREIDLHLSYYPVDDVYYFIDMIREIDRRYRDGIQLNSQN